VEPAASRVRAGLHGASVVSGMVPRRYHERDLADVGHSVRRTRRHLLELAIGGWGDGKGSDGRGSGRTESDRSGKEWHEAESGCRCPGRSVGSRHRRSERPRYEAAPTDNRVDGTCQAFHSPAPMLGQGLRQPDRSRRGSGRGIRGGIRRIGEENARKHPDGKPRRWVVERTLAWLSKCRALLVRYDKHDINFLGLLQLACALLWFRRLARVTG
jgi:hypothetical protein